jgi:hypothetical protein
MLVTHTRREIVSRFPPWLGKSAFGGGRHALDFLPGNALPGRHQGLTLCFGSSPPTHRFTVHNTGPTSAYPGHYPGPWLLRASASPAASGWHLLREATYPTEGYWGVTPFPALIARILRAVLSTGFLGSAYRSVCPAAGALSCAILAPAPQPLALVRFDDGSTTPSLTLSIDACSTGYPE